MIAFLNHNSYAISAAILLALAAWEVWRRRPTWLSVGLFALLALLVTLPPLYVRSGGSVASTGELDAAITSGKPTLLELYSDL